MPRFTPKRYEQILTQMIAKVVTRTRLSDVSNASVWKHVLAASARSDDEIYYQMTLLRKLFDLDKVVGDDLIQRAKEIQPGTIVYAGSAKSTGNVVFYRNTTSGTVPIASGTRIANSTGKAFVTTSAGSITPTSPVLISGHVVGQDSGLIPVVAEVGGADGNALAGTVTKFLTKPPGVDGVVNITSFAHGADAESADSFRSRIRQYIANLARSTIGAIENSVLGSELETTGAVIRFAKLIEDYYDRGYTTLYIDDGTGSAMSTEAVSGENVTAGLAGPPADSAVGGETRLYLDYKPIDESTLILQSSTRALLSNGVHYYCDPATGQINFTPVLSASEVITAGYTRYTGLIEYATKIVYGDPADRENYPGYRGAGIQVIVTTPQVVVQTVELNIVASEGYDKDELKTAVKGKVRDYINALGISGDVVLSAIVSKAKSVPGVYDVTVITPTTNQVMLDDQMARTTDANITVN